MADNKETLRGLYEAFAKGDVPTVLGMMTSDISWTEAEGFPYAGTSIGPDAVLQNVFMKLATEWEGFSAIPAEYIADGDKVVALGEYSGTYLATGKSFKSPFAHVYSFRDGKLANFFQYTDTVLVQKALS